MRHALALVVLLAGCDTVLDPTGAYTGEATRSGETGRMTTGPEAGGTLVATTQRFSSALHAAPVLVVRVDETHLDIDIGDGCHVRFEHPAMINVDGATALASSGQLCDLQLDGGSLPVSIDGTASFEREASRMTVSLTGDARTGDPDRAGYTWTRWSYTFEGARNPAR